MVNFVAMKTLLTILLAVVALASCKKNAADDIAVQNDTSFINEIRFYGNAEKFQATIQIFKENKFEMDTFVGLNTNGEINNQCYKWVDTYINLPYTYKSNRKLTIPLSTPGRCTLDKGDTVFIEVWHQGKMVASGFQTHDDEQTKDKTLSTE